MIHAFPWRGCGEVVEEPSCISWPMPEMVTQWYRKPSYRNTSVCCQLSCLRSLISLKTLSWGLAAVAYDLSKEQLTTAATQATPHPNLLQLHFWRQLWWAQEDKETWFHLKRGIGIRHYKKKKKKKVSTHFLDILWTEGSLPASERDIGTQEKQSSPRMSQESLPSSFAFLRREFLHSRCPWRKRVHTEVNSVSS